MRLRKLEDADADADGAESSQEMQSDVTSNQERWFNGNETYSCHICQKFLETCHRKNLYKARYIQLQEESEQMIKSLSSSFEEAINHFRLLIEDKLKENPGFRSHGLHLTDQLAMECKERAKLELEMKALNRLLETEQDEHERERAQWRRALKEREKTIQMLNNNVYYFLRKLKFKRSPRSVLKRMHFKRNIRNIISSNISNIRLLAGKLMSPDSNNFNYHYYIKSKQLERDNVADTESSMAPSRSSDTNLTLIPLAIEALRSDTACLHRAIVDDPLSGDGDGDDYCPSHLEAATRHNCDNEKTCHCNGFNGSAPGADLTNNTHFSGDEECTSFPARNHNRTKYSIVCRQCDVIYDDDKWTGLRGGEGMKGRNLPNGDCNDCNDFPLYSKLGGMGRASSFIPHPEGKDETSFCGCSHSSSTQPKDGSEAGCSSAPTSISEDYLQDTESDSSANFSERREMCARHSYSNRTLTQERSRQIQESGLLVPQKPTWLENYGEPGRNRKRDSQATVNSAPGALELIDFEIPQFLAGAGVEECLEGRRGLEPRSKVNSQRDIDTLGEELFRKLTTEHGAGPLSKKPNTPKSQRVVPCLSTVQELSNESVLSRGNSKEPWCPSRGGGGGGGDGGSQPVWKARVPDEAHKRILQWVGLKNHENEANEATDATDDADTEADLSDELESILGRGSTLHPTPSVHGPPSIQNFGYFPLRTESAPAKLQTVSSDFFL